MSLGPDVDMLIEIHRRLAPMYAVQLAQQIAELPALLVRRAVPGGEPRRAGGDPPADISIPVVTGEAIYGKAGFAQVFEKRAADIINPDVANTGGILELKEIAAMAEPHYVAVSPHNYNSTVMALASTVHASAVMPNFLITEYFVPFAEIGTQVSNQFVPENGFHPTAQTPPA